MGGPGPCTPPWSPHHTDTRLWEGAGDRLSELRLVRLPRCRQLCNRVPLNPTWVAPNQHIWQIRLEGHRDSLLVKSSCDQSRPGPVCTGSRSLARDRADGATMGASALRGLSIISKSTRILWAGQRVSRVIILHGRHHPDWCQHLQSTKLRCCDAPVFSHGAGRPHPMACFTKLSVSQS